MATTWQVCITWTRWHRESRGTVVFSEALHTYMNTCYKAASVMVGAACEVRLYAPTPMSCSGQTSPHPLAFVKPPRCHWTLFSVLNCAIAPSMWESSSPVTSAALNY